MAQIDLLNDELLEGLPDFNQRAWRYPDTAGFLNWFFCDSPNTTVLVAHDQGRWMAVLGVFVRSYLFGDERVACGETFAWETAHDCRGQGVGIKTIKAMIDIGKPLVALGGSADTVNFMPRVGFQVLGQAPALNLPLSPRAVGGKAGIAGLAGPKGALAKLGLTMIAPALKPRAGGSHGVRNVPIAMLDDDTLAMRPLPGFQAMYEPAFFHWLARTPVHTATFLPFRFERDEELVGWAFARVSEEAPGETVGRILEFKFAPGTTAAEHKAMAAAVTAALAGLGSIIVRATATCPDTNRALRSLRFMSRLHLPAMVHPAGRSAPAETLRMSMIRADGALLPLPLRLQD